MVARAYANNMVSDFKQSCPIYSYNEPEMEKPRPASSSSLCLSTTVPADTRGIRQWR